MSDTSAARAAEVAGKLAEIRDLIAAWEASATGPESMDTYYGRAAEVAGRAAGLLAATEAVLKLAEPHAEIDLDIDGYPEGGVAYYVTCDRLREAISSALLGKEAADGQR